MLLTSEREEWLLLSSGGSIGCLPDDKTFLTGITGNSSLTFAGWVIITFVFYLNSLLNISSEKCGLSHYFFFKCTFKNLIFYLV